jgi:hypothetical protein
MHERIRTNDLLRWFDLALEWNAASFSETVNAFAWPFSQTRRYHGPRFAHTNDNTLPCLKYQLLSNMSIFREPVMMPVDNRATIENCCLRFCCPINAAK